MKTFFKRSKSQMVWPLEQLTSKSSFSRYLKNGSMDFHEIWNVYSNKHDEYLYSFGGLGNVNFLSSRGSVLGIQTLKCQNFDNFVFRVVSSYFY